MLQVSIVGLLLKLLTVDVSGLMSKMLLVRCARCLIESIWATCHIVTESAIWNDGCLGLRCHGEKVGRGLVLAVAIVASRWWQGSCACYTRVEETWGHGQCHLIIDGEGWCLHLYGVVIATKLWPARCPIIVILKLTTWYLLEPIGEIHGILRTYSLQLLTGTSAGTINDTIL